MKLSSEDKERFIHGDINVVINLGGSNNISVNRYDTRQGLINKCVESYKPEANGKYWCGDDINGHKMYLPLCQNTSKVIEAACDIVLNKAYITLEKAASKAIEENELEKASDFHKQMSGIIDQTCKKYGISDSADGALRDKTYVLRAINNSYKLKKEVAGLIAASPENQSISPQSEALENELEALN
jgi:ribosomal protein S20